MAFQLRRCATDTILVAVVSSLNALRAVAASSWGVIHADTTSSTSGDFQNPTTKPATIAAPPATDLPTLLALCAEIAGRHAQHVHDALAHRAPDSTNALASAAPTTLPAALAFLNDAKAKWNAHQTQAGVHFANDAGDAITAADATDLPSAIALANTYRALHAAHITSALFGASIQLLEP